MGAPATAAGPGRGVVLALAHEVAEIRTATRRVTAAMRGIATVDVEVDELFFDRLHFPVDPPRDLA